MAKTWDSAVKDATKILGEKGKVPKLAPAITKSLTAFDKAYEAFDKARQDLKAKLLAMQAASDATKDAYVQFQDEIEESDLGLDSKNKDDVKKIADAQKILSAWVQQNVDTSTQNYKNLRELDRHLMSLVNYKQGA
jgi:hypothetical protein